jgi:hypothetical protein
MALRGYAVSMQQKRMLTTGIDLQATASARSPRLASVVPRFTEAIEREEVCDHSTLWKR